MGRLGWQLIAGWILLLKVKLGGKLTLYKVDNKDNIL